MDIKHCDLADAIHDRDKQIRNLKKDIESHKESCADINFKRISFMDENVSLMEDLQDIIKLFSEYRRNGECNMIQLDNITKRVKSRAYDFKRIENYSDKIKCLTADMEAQGNNCAKSKAEIR